MKFILTFSFLLACTLSLGFDPAVVKQVYHRAVTDTLNSYVFRSNMLIPTDYIKDESPFDSKNPHSMLQTFLDHVPNQKIDTTYLVIDLMSRQEEGNFIKLEEQLLKEETKLVEFISVQEFDYFIYMPKDIPTNNLKNKYGIHLKLFHKLKTIFKRMDYFLDNKYFNNVVIFHCMHGKDRTGFFNVAWNLHLLPDISLVKEEDLAVST